MPINPTKLSPIQFLGRVLLIGSFMYMFEIYYHGFEIGDFNKAQVILTFSIFLFSATLIFTHEYIDDKLKAEDLKKAAGFLGIAILFLFLIFYTRNMNPLISLAFAVVFFISASILALKKIGARTEDPTILFAMRFCILLGLAILPTAGYQYITAGAIDFKFESVYMPMIKFLTPATQILLSLVGVATVATPKEGGITLATADGSFRVFVGALCSGVASLSVFTIAFAAMAWDLKISKGKKALLLVAGAAGTVFANILRITILFLVGLTFGEKALMTMHTHLGWILYFFWITVFWHIAFKLAEK
jgi:exosortase/archaeosortase family protein